MISFVDSVDYAVADDGEVNPVVEGAFENDELLR